MLNTISRSSSDPGGFGAEVQNGAFAEIVAVADFQRGEFDPGAILHPKRELLP